MWSWSRRAARRPRPRARMSELQYGVIPDLEKKQARGPADKEGGQTENQAAAQQGHRRGNCRGRLQVDRHPGVQDARRRAGQAAAHGRPCTERVVGQDEAVDGRLQRRPPLPRRARRPQSADRLVSCSSARPASARPSCARRWPTSCSTPKTPWCASTCPSSWRSTPWPG